MPWYHLTAFKHLDKFSCGNRQQLIPGKGLKYHDKEHQSEHQIKKPLFQQNKMFKYVLIQNFLRQENAHFATSGKACVPYPFCQQSLPDTMARMRYLGIPTREGQVQLWIHSTLGWRKHSSEIRRSIFFTLSLLVLPLYSWTFFRGENLTPNISVQTCSYLPVINYMLCLNQIST